jgi:hypothetical protein
MAGHEPVRARPGVKSALESEQVLLRPADDGHYLVAKYGLEPVQLATGTRSEMLVAGARFFAYSLEAELR